MIIQPIKTIARGVARFVKFQDGKLWYVVTCADGDGRVGCGNFEVDFEFPIPVEDAGGGEFLPSDKALRFLRWIRKHHQYLSAAPDASREEQST